MTLTIKELGAAHITELGVEQCVREKTTATETIFMCYKNHRGKVSTRKIRPRKLWFGSTECHTDEQWFLTAFDIHKGAIRDFALGDCDFSTPKPSL